MKIACALKVSSEIRAQGYLFKFTVEWDIENSVHAGLHYPLSMLSMRKSER